MINSTAQELYSFALFFMFNLTELRAPHEQTWAKDKGICLLFYQIVKCYIAVKCLHTPIFLEYFEQQLWLDLELGQRRGIIFSHFYPDCWRCPFTHVECKLHFFFFYNFFLSEYLMWFIPSKKIFDSSKPFGDIETVSFRVFGCRY